MDSIERIKSWKFVFQDDKKSLPFVTLLIFIPLIVIALSIMTSYSERFVETTQLLLIITALILSLIFLLIVADLTILAAGKVIDRTLDKKAHRQLIDKVLEESTALKKE